MTPTEEEARNGWTEDSLSKYIEQRNEAGAIKNKVVDTPYQPWGQRMDPNRPKQAINEYNPYRW